jgi:L-fuconolactonase
MEMTANERAAKFGSHYPPDLEWLALAPPEEAIEPSLPIIDTHHQLGMINRLGDPNIPGQTMRYSVEEYADDAASGHNLVASVFVEGFANWRKSGPAEMRPVGEVEFANGMAAMAASGFYGRAQVAAAIVGHADLSRGAMAGSVIDALIAAGNGRLRGVRYNAHWDPDPATRNGIGVNGPGLYLTKSYIEGAREVVARGLTLETFVYYPQLEDICYVADALPDARIVLSHMGAPLGQGGHGDDPARSFDIWRRNMEMIAERPNVTNRIRNYMGRSEPPDSAQLAADWRDYVLATLDMFGPERCMFASSFPVDKQGATWVAHWNAHKRIVADASDEEKRRMFSGTAAETYLLDLDTLMTP